MTKIERPLTHSEKKSNTLSIILNIPVEQLKLLDSQGILDRRAINKLLLKYEYDRIIKTKQYAKKQVIVALMADFEVSKSYVENVIYQKNDKGKFRCVSCGSFMSRYKYYTYKGTCDECNVKKIVTEEIFNTEEKHKT